MKITRSENWQQIKKLIPSNLFELFLAFYYSMRSIKYFGNKIYCPICTKKHSKFVLNSSSECPKCGGAVRHRTLWLFLKKRTNFFKDELKVLHFAPEYCYLKKINKANNLDYTSADFSSPRAMEKIDMTNINYPNNYFDVSISVDVLDDIDNDLKAIEELYRVQKFNGWSIHLSPIDYNRKTTFEDPEIITSEQRLKYYGAYANKRIYGKDYQDRLASKGFKVEVYETIDFCSEEEIIEMGLQKDFKIYFLMK